jgi:hypothetical protein
LVQNDTSKVYLDDEEPEEIEAMDLEETGLNNVYLDKILDIFGSRPKQNTFDAQLETGLLTTIKIS